MEQAQQITFTNKDLLDQITMGKVEERWMKTHDGEDMLDHDHLSSSFRSE